MGEFAGGRAFPRQFKRWDSDFRRWETQEPEAGMSLRDYFAAKAMQAFIAGSFDKDDQSRALGLTPRAAYEMADAMLKAREA